MKDMTISVIVPVYNCENYLKNCVSSLLNQTYQKIEIVLVNDGSVDASGKMCDALAAEYPCVKSVHQENSGAAAARRNGVFYATGEYIAFVDADDWVEKDYLEQFVALIEIYNVDAVVGSIRNYDGNTYSDGVSFFEPGFYDKTALQNQVYPKMLSAEPFYTFGIMPSMCAKLWRKSIVEKNLEALCIGVTFGEDGCFTYASLLDCNSICITEDAHYIYRLNEQSATHSFKQWLFAETPVLRNYLEELSIKKNWDIGAQLDEYIAYVCNYVVWYTVTVNGRDYPKLRTHLKDYVKQNFPSAVVKSKKFNTASKHTKMRFILINKGWFSVLRGLLKFKSFL